MEVNGSIHTLSRRTARPAG